MSYHPNDCLYQFLSITCLLSHKCNKPWCEGDSTHKQNMALTSRLRGTLQNDNNSERCGHGNALAPPCIKGQAQGTTKPGLPQLCGITRPHCLRCQRAHRQCPGYTTTRIFEEISPVQDLYSVSRTNDRTLIRHCPALHLLPWDLQIEWSN